MEDKIDRLSQLKVKGLVIGPIHVAPLDNLVSLNFEEISSDVGNLEQFKGLITAAHKKSECSSFFILSLHLMSYQL